MHRMIVFLRGVNVGGSNILPMKELSALLVGAGFSEVKTYIQSGNVVLTSPQKSTLHVAKKIEEEIQRTKGFKVNVLAQSMDQLNLAIENCPYTTDDGKLLHFFFLSESVKRPDLSLLDKVKSATEQYQWVGQVLYLFAPDGIGRSKLVTKVEKAMGVPVTARNWNTIKKLADLSAL